VPRPAAMTKISMWAPSPIRHHQSMSLFFITKTHINPNKQHRQMKQFKGSVIGFLAIDKPIAIIGSTQFSLSITL